MPLLTKQRPRLGVFEVFEEDLDKEFNKLSICMRYRTLNLLF